MRFAILVCKTAVHPLYRDFHWSQIRGMSTFNGSSAPSYSVGTSALQRCHPAIPATIDCHECWLGRGDTRVQTCDRALLTLLLCRRRQLKQKARSSHGSPTEVGVSKPLLQSQSRELIAASASSKTNLRHAPEKPRKRRAGVARRLAPCG
jgi:hypothetical protein